MVWKLAQSEKVEKVFAAPGNGGTAVEEKTENFSPKGLDPASEEGQKALLEFAKKEKIDLTVVGPEAPLAAGIVDVFRAEGQAIVGPGENAARLETGKFAKPFMEKYGVRTAKAGGSTNPEGLEVSVMAAVSVIPGKTANIKTFLPAKDHKRLLKGNLGQNTEGMGAVVPVPDFSTAIRKDFETAILTPTLKGIAAEKMDYRGFINFGLTVKDGQCCLLEYNVRLGDPGTQAVLPLLGSDLVELCMAILDGSLANFPIKWRRGAVCTPVAAAEGYPGPYRLGDPVAINPTMLMKTGAKLFVAGAIRGPGGALGSGLRTNGGRVFSVSAMGSDADEARWKAYEALRFIGFEGMVFRSDIGLEKKGAGDLDG